MDDQGFVDLIETRKRARGGWLAITSRLALVRIGATGDSEVEAKAKLAYLLAGWRIARDAEQSSH